MKNNFLLITILLLSACSFVETTVPVSTIISTATPAPILSTTTPTLIPKGQSKPITKGNLECSPIGTFTKCVDDVLSIEFEHPVSWGQIDTGLGKGFTSGYFYGYSFSEYSHTETDFILAGGRSKDFSEPRGFTPLDFKGYGNKPEKEEGCDSRWQDIYTICEEISPNVTWMIQLPNANHFCNSPNGPTWYTTALFRIEINLPNNPTINGFVFESSFSSKDFLNQLENDLYPILGIGSNGSSMYPTKCSDENQKAFDQQLNLIVDKINNKTVDKETQNNIDELIHLAMSIHSR
jgi:hypothetical protein